MPTSFCDLVLRPADLEWLEPMFHERLKLENGRMLVPDRPGLGFSLTDQARAWTSDRVDVTSPG
ncbi:hypothetical protein WIS52_19955 [Pseudonocardia nematodicida]|uniref:Enolase C-terminal domain-containing protein n=1 Tax=Pseudonocardia nematodicida TaxID=1206997 RepID=A0ABV1KFT7_9PSEU